MDNNFSKNLKKLRKEKNLSQEQLAEELNVSRQAISKWESSTAYPEMDKIISLCDKFQVNIDDLLYKDVTEANSEKEAKKSINTFTNDFLNFITDTVNLFSKMTFKSKIKCLFEQLIIILVLLILSSIISHAGSVLVNGIFNMLPTNIVNIIDKIIVAIIKCACYIATFIIVINTFKTRYLNYYQSTKVEKEEKTEKENKSNSKKDLKEEKIIIRDDKDSDYTFLNSLFKIIIFFVKLFAISFGLFLCETLIFFVICFGLSFLVSKSGLFFLGIILGSLSCIAINLVLLIVIINFIFNRKTNKKKMIYTFLISLLTFGISVSLVFTGLTKFNLVEDPSFQTNTLEYEMTPDIYIRSYNDIEYIEEDIPNIRIEYNYNDNFDVKATLKNDNKEIYVYTYCKDEMNYLRDILSEVNKKHIPNLNVRQYTIKIYANAENIELLKSNKKQVEEVYYNEDDYDEDLETEND